VVSIHCLSSGVRTPEFISIFVVIPPFVRMLE
jgi:hypothetical protein